MSPPVFICTGSNRGIGRAIVESLAAKGPAKVIYATSRGGQDLGLHATHDNVIKYARLDVTDRQSVDTLREEIEGQYGEVQAVINNAGRNIDDQPYSFDAVDQTLATNLYGVVNVCNAFLPLMAKKGRIVNVASVAGHLKPYKEPARSKLQQSTSSVRSVLDLVEEYKKLVQSGKEVEEGYTKRPYTCSKGLLVAYTKALANENPDLYINACYTDMGAMMGKPSKSQADGAKIPLRLALGDISNSTGEFWENDSISSAADGKISVW